MVLPTQTDPNPFDDPAVSQANNDAAWGDNSGAFGQADAYEVKNNVPPPPPVQANNDTFGDTYENTGYDNNTGYEAETGYDNTGYDNTSNNDAYGDAYGQADDGAYGDNNDNKISQKKDIQALQIQEMPADQLQISCFGYSYGPVWGYGVVCGLLLLLAGVLDFLKMPSFLDLVVNVYLVLIGWLIMMAEAPPCYFNLTVKQSFFKWARFTRRTWGKASLFFFLAVLCCTDGGLKTGLGVLVMLICFFLWFVAIQTARLGKKMANRTMEGMEEADLEIHLERVFKGLAVEGSLTNDSIVRLGKQAGLLLNSAEVSMIYSFFDEDFDGKVTLEEFKLGIPRLNSGTNFL